MGDELGVRGGRGGGKGRFRGREGGPGREDDRRRRRKILWDFYLFVRVGREVKDLIWEVKGKI